MNLTLGSYDVPAASAVTHPKPRLIVYAGGESPGAEVQSRADATHLRGAPRSFQRFTGRTAQRLTDRATCEVNDCGGYAALWAVAHGHWKEIQGTQEIWSCAVLKRHEVPSSIAGHTCYDYRAQRTRHYHQR